MDLLSISCHCDETILAVHP